MFSTGEGNCCVVVVHSARRFQSKAAIVGTQLQRMILWVVFI